MNFKDLKAKEQKKIDLVNILDNPVSNTVTIEPTEEKKTTNPVAVNTVSVESKSKRVNLLIKPTIHKQIVKQAKKMKISVNEFINQAIEEKLNK